MKLKWLKDKLGEKFYPIAHATGVVVTENKTLDSKLAEIDTEIGNKANKTEIPTELPANGGNADTVGGHTVKSDVPENAVFTDTVYDYSALLGYDIYNLVSLKDATYPANKTWLSKDFVAPFNGFVFFMVQTDGTSGAFNQVFKEDDVLISNNQKNIADFNTWGCAYYMGIAKGKTYHFGSYTNAATAFNKVMLCIRKKFEIPTEYIPYAPSNIALAEETNDLSKRISTNGYGETAGGKNLADFSKLGTKTTNGITFEYQSNGSIKASGTVSTDGNVYTPLELTKTRLSKGCWYTTSVKSSNPNSVAKVFFTGKGDTTTLQMSETADLYYYIQFVPTDSTNNNLTDGTVIDEVLYPQIEEGTVSTEYEPYFPSNRRLAEDKADKSETTVNLLNPTLESTIVNGITVTNNGDGTYTLNGTASNDTSITTQVIKPDKSKKYKLVGCPKGGSDSTYDLTMVSPENNYSDFRHDYGNGTIVDNLQFENYNVTIGIVNGTTLNNVIFKPMLTTNLNTVYDDFVPYTGDTGSLNGDVADLRGDMYFEKEISLAKAQLIRNGSYSDINIISSLFFFGADGKIGLSRGYISLSLPFSFSKKDEIYIKLPYKQYGYKKDDLLPYIYKTVFCTQGDFNGKIIGTCNLSYYSSSDDEGISLTIDINDNYSFTDSNISSAYINLRF